jgi:hypothetical protein
MGCFAVIEVVDVTNRSQLPIDQPPNSGFMRFIAMLLVIVLPAAPGVGASLIVSTMSRLATEELVEHCSAKTEIREVSHRRSQDKLSHSSSHSFVQRNACCRCQLKLPVCTCDIYPIHLLGAGIAMRC